MPFPTNMERRLRAITLKVALKQDPILLVPFFQMIASKIILTNILFDDYTVYIYIPSQRYNIHQDKHTLINDKDFSHFKSFL